MTELFPHEVVMMRVVDDPHGLIPQAFIDRAFTEAPETETWLKEYSQILEKTYSVDIEIYYQNQQRGVSVTFRFKDPKVAMLFKLAFGSIY